MLVRGGDAQAVEGEQQVMGENGPQSPREGALLSQIGEGLTGVLEGGWPVGRQ
ncbi:MAG: hypothetical protein ACRDTD_07125 [Pseudonocardiaceae bacterium]